MNNKISDHILKQRAHSITSREKNIFLIKMLSQYLIRLYFAFMQWNSTNSEVSSSSKLVSET